MIHHQASIRFQSDPCLLQVVRAVISEIGQLAGLTEKTRRLVTLAVDEACANIIRHTYNNEFHHTIELKCRVNDNRLEFCLVDFGNPMNVEEIKHRELSEIRPGGLGTFFMQNIMDRIEYENLSPRGNQVKLIKYLHQEDSS